MQPLGNDALAAEAGNDVLEGRPGADWLNGGAGGQPSSRWAMADRSSVIYHARAKGKEVIARLKAHGWLVDRVHGSHHILSKEGKAVPVHGSRDLGAGLLAARQRQTGVKLK